MQKPFSPAPGSRAGAPGELTGSSSGCISLIQQEMRAGSFLRELSRLRRGLAISLLLGVLGALLSTFKVGLLPPSITPRSLQIAAASTEVLVDTNYSTIADLRAADTGTELSTMTTRADLLGNIIATAPVEAYIGRYVGVNPARIDVSAPITADVPRVVVEPGSGQSATAILASADHYKLEVQADPSVPILHIYSQAPNKAAAIRLANGAVEGLRNYIQSVSTSQRIGRAEQVRLEQFGTAQGGIVNGGVAVQIALLAFLTTFSICCAGTVFIARVVRGFRFAAALERAPS